MGLLPCDRPFLDEDDPHGVPKPFSLLHARVLSPKSPKWFRSVVLQIKPGCMSEARG